ncbi:ROK family protein [Brachybacterium alimentarium]|uniref:ROK family protein n=1 Tax=Brachybacterium alimentarium TaxID=47845 RepID=UPI003FD32F86
MSTVRDRGASSPQVLRQANRQALLQHALFSEEFTAADAMGSTGLTRATVLGLCSDLESAGWLQEVAEERGDGAARRGRPARRFALRDDAAVIIGIDAGEHSLTARVADLRGREIAAARTAVGGAAVGAAARVEAVRQLIDCVVEEAGARTSRRLLTVVGVPAPVDGQGCSPHGENDFWPSMNPGFVDALDGEVLVENDANLAVIAEHSLGGSEHMGALLMGERFGAGLIVDGRLLRGADGGAGEMRFLDVVLEDSRGADGVAALARRWSVDALAAGQESPALSAIPRGELSAVDVFAAARAGDALAVAVLNRIGARVARIAAILASLLGVQRIVLAGAISEAIGPVLDHARAILPEITSEPLPELIASSLGRDVVVRGAIEHALSRLRADPLELLGPDL